MSLTPETYAEARTLDPKDEKGGWWVFWQNATGYGARGLNLSKQQAESLADRIRQNGPTA
jgi:hypothetical protein